MVPIPEADFRIVDDVVGHVTRNGETDVRDLNMFALSIVFGASVTYHGGRVRPHILIVPSHRLALIFLPRGVFSYCPSAATLALRIRKESNVSRRPGERREDGQVVPERRSSGNDSTQPGKLYCPLNKDILPIAAITRRPDRFPRFSLGTWTGALSTLAVIFPFTDLSTGSGSFRGFDGGDCGRVEGSLRIILENLWGI